MEMSLSSAHHEGRLELTWTNKDKRLLAYEDGSYVWVPPSDYRVAEVRLLDDAGTVGEVSPPYTRAADNLLIRGDALRVVAVHPHRPVLPKQPLYPRARSTYALHMISSVRLTLRRFGCPKTGSTQRARWLVDEGDGDRVARALGHILH